MKPIRLILGTATRLRENQTVYTLTAVFSLLLTINATASVLYVDLSCTNPTPPFTNWITAATNIQDAVDAALAGDEVVVTNGVYNIGGRAVDGLITNRVVLDKALTLQSVNGSGVTIIQGAYDPTSTNGPAAVRCVWMTNNALLSGFTLRGGATAAGARPQDNSMMGGGVWASSTSATVDHCLVVSNCASYAGGGAYQATLINCQVVANRSLGCSGCSINAGFGGGAGYCNLRNCVITGNVTPVSVGGGTYYCNLTNCALQGNSAWINGGAAAYGSLVNSTLSSNSSALYGGSTGGAAYLANLTNCILWGNFVPSSSTRSNYLNCILAYCCTAPLPTGTGNTAVDPQLLPDGLHLAQTSPCRGVGLTNWVSGTDVDGQAWADPPALGCDEWQPAPVLACQPTGQPFSAVGRIAVGAVAAGQAPFDYYWYKDGLALGNGAKYGSVNQSTLVISNAGPSDAGAYVTIVSNAYGVATSQVARVVIHCVDAAGRHAQPPFADWATASTNIQTAIDLASAGEFVLVTNGLYASGGKPIWSGLTNRVALDKALTVMSVNGAAVTTIQGAWDPATTNGPAAVRCAALTNGAALNGFTLIGGATWGTSGAEIYAGGVYGSGWDCRVMNCNISSNTASAWGGGAANCWLMNCLLVGNRAPVFDGGGAYAAKLVNSTIVANSCVHYGGGAYQCGLTNCIIAFNSTDINLNPDLFSCSQSYCCVPSKNLGGNNIFADPQLLDNFHLAANSPCRGAGSPGYAIGTDLEGDPWLNPPSIGCDEAGSASFSGPLHVAIQPPATSALVNHVMSLTGVVTGRATHLDWSFGDGVLATNTSFMAYHTWSNTGDYTVTLTAYNTDNPGGVSATQVVNVSLPAQPVLQGPVIVTNSMQFTFAMQAGVTYVTEVATNLAPAIQWQPIKTNNALVISLTAQVTDPVSTNAARFYRVRAR
jgi:hypothetical protein